MYQIYVMQQLYRNMFFNDEYVWNELFDWEEGNDMAWNSLVDLPILLYYA